MNNEPVAIRYDFDGYGYRYIDSGSGSDWASLNKNVDGEFLYTHPAKEHFEDEPQAEELHEIMQSNAELTDEEIIAEADKQDWLGLTSKSEWQPEIDFARAILRKAQEKCNGFCGEYECKENQSNCKRKAQEK